MAAPLHAANDMKKRLALIALGFAWKLFVARQRAFLHTASVPRLTIARRPDDKAMRRFVGYFVLPVWLAGGFLDYIWHRRTKIETTTGLSESLMHTLLMAEAAPAVFGALFLEINAGVIAMILAAAAIHEATAVWDVVFTAPRRRILPAEQHIHSFLEMVPFCVASAAICMHWDQARALFKRGSARPDFALRLRHPRVHSQYLAAIMSAFALIGGVPHLDELRRCLASHRAGLVGIDTPECARELFA